MALVLGLGVGLWVNQNATQNEKLDAVRAQQAAAAQAQQQAAAAQAQQQAAAAQAQQQAAAAQAQRDQNAAITQAQRDAAEAKARAEALQQQQQIIVPPAYPGGPSYPIFNANGGSVNVRTGPSSSASSVGTVVEGQYVTLSCTVYGDQVGTTSLWDYITSPVPGFVADHFIHTGTNDPVVRHC